MRGGSRSSASALRSTTSARSPFAAICCARRGPLTLAERLEIQVHPTAGAALVAPLRRGSVALPYVLFHHERWDGSGYPRGLCGNSIPVEARLLAVADAFDAMISARPYRVPLSETRCIGRARHVRRVAVRSRHHGGVLRRMGRSHRRVADRGRELADRYTDDQTSSFSRTRSITSSVNSLEPRWPPRSAVRAPAATASRQASRIARPARWALSPA